MDARLGQCDKQPASAGAVCRVPALSPASSVRWRPGCDTVEVKNTTFLASSSSWVFSTSHSFCLSLHSTLLYETSYSLHPVVVEGLERSRMFLDAVAL